MILPPTLLFSDDYYDDYKKLGLKMLSHVVHNVVCKICEKITIIVMSLQICQFCKGLLFFGFHLGY